VQTVAEVVQARAVAAGFELLDLAGHSLNRGALTTGMKRGIRPAKLKRLGRHGSFDVLGDYLEFGDLFEGYPQTSGVGPLAAFASWLAHRRPAADLDWTDSASAPSARCSAP